MSYTYAISGATGNIGHRIVETLLAAGHRVRAMSRSAQNLDPLVKKGAEAFVGSLEDLSFVTDAYQGVDGVFAMIPPNYISEDYRSLQNLIADVHVTAMENTGVSHVVALSSIGAHLREGAGIVLGLHDFEERLTGLIKTNILILRPSYFMENILIQLDVIKNMGVTGSPLDAEVSQPVVSTRDIADLAARRLSTLDFSKHSVEYVLGPRDLSYEEITHILGHAIGKEDLSYVRFPDHEAREGMMNMGMSADIAELMLGLSHGINSGKVLADARRTKTNTSPTTIEEFASEFARAYQAAP